MNMKHAMKGDVEVTYLPYLEGGRGLTNLEKEYKAANAKIKKYMKHKDDMTSKIKALLKHQRFNVSFQYQKKQKVPR